MLLLARAVFASLALVAYFAALADPDCLPGFADPVAQSFPAALTRSGSFAQIGYPDCLPPVALPLRIPVVQAAPQ